MAMTWPQLGDVLAEQSEARQFTFIRLGAIGPVIGGGLALIAPWSIAVLIAFFRGARGLTDADRRAHRWLVFWVLLSAVPFLFLMAFERYLIPMVAPMAVLAARLLEDATQRARRVHLVIAVAVLGLPAIAFSGFTLWFGLAIAAPAAALVLWGGLLRASLRGASARAIALGCAVLVMLLLGGVYPAIGINRLPDDLPADLRERDLAVFQIAQPGMISMRAQHSVLSIPDGADVRSLLTGFDGYVFVADERNERFLAELGSAGLTPERVGGFRSFYSRKAWLRFARDGAKWPEWREALTTRSLEGLKPGFTYYRVRG